MGLQLLTAPAREPVEIYEAQAWCRADSSEDTSVLELLISAARARVEDYTRRALVSQQWRFTADGFPRCGTLNIPLNPVVSIDSFSYLPAPSGEAVTLTDEEFVADFSSAPARLAAPYGSSWPIARPQPGSVIVDFTAGYVQTDASPETGTVPADLKIALLMIMAHMFENRESQEIPDGAKDLMFGYRVPES